MDGTGARKQASKQDSRQARQTDRQTPRLVMRGEEGLSRISPPHPLPPSLCTSQVSILEMNGGERMGKWDGKFRAFLQNGRTWIETRKKDCEGLHEKFSVKDTEFGRCNSNGWCTDFKKIDDIR